jgi:phosphonopyruvate decarboxylase
MASGKLALVYMQNSGLGNAVNPLMSLVHKGVYAIPMLLLIGYRGEPGKPDERQHRAMGEATEALLSAMGIDTFALNAESDPTSTLQQAAACALAQSGPVAVLVSSSAFATAGVALHYESSLSITRQEVLNVLLDHLEGSEVVCSTTGYTSRELYDLRVSRSAVSAQKQADFFERWSYGSRFTGGFRNCFSTAGQKGNCH